MFLLGLVGQLLELCPGILGGRLYFLVVCTVGDFLAPSCRYNCAGSLARVFSTVLSNAFGLSGNGPPTAFSQASPTREDALAAIWPLTVISPVSSFTKARADRLARLGCNLAGGVEHLRRAKPGSFLHL